jgi:superfamily II RNA helicase
LNEKSADSDPFILRYHQPCHVVYTDYRPTPLQHYIFPGGGDGLHLVVDELGNFREVRQASERAREREREREKMKKTLLPCFPLDVCHCPPFFLLHFFPCPGRILSCVPWRRWPRKRTRPKRTRPRARRVAPRHVAPRWRTFLLSSNNIPTGSFIARFCPVQAPSDCFKIVKLIMERNMQPVIVFSFSKKVGGGRSICPRHCVCSCSSLAANQECELHAMAMSKLDFTTDEEKASVDEIFTNAMASLSEVSPASAAHGGGNVVCAFVCRPFAKFLHMLACFVCCLQSAHKRF